MSDARSAWNDAGERLTGLGASLKQHYEARQGAEVAPEDKPVAEAFARVGEALQGAFDALASAAKDPVVKDEVKQTGRSVADAMAATLSEVSEGVRKAFEGEREDGPASADAPTPQDDEPAGGGTGERPGE
jgi:Flp pilus assembly pilin Flp